MSAFEETREGCGALQQMFGGRGSRVSGGRLGVSRMNLDRALVARLPGTHPSNLQPPSHSRGPRLTKIRAIIQPGTGAQRTEIGAVKL